MQNALQESRQGASASARGDYSQIHNDIQNLQSKIKGLESAIIPKAFSANQSEVAETEAKSPTSSTVQKLDMSMEPKTQELSDILPIVARYEV